MSQDRITVFYLSSEVYPFSKTGGLGDVAGALPVSLKKAGVDISIITPFYSRFQPMEPVEISETGINLNFWIGGTVHQVEILKSEYREVPVYLVKNDHYFGRKGLYGESGKDYPDNAERFALYTYASLELIKKLSKRVDILHLNDWQTALVPVILVDHNDKFYEGTGLFITVHNLAYQGLFPPAVLPKIKISYHMFHMEALEFYGKVNFLKGGLMFSDLIGTVSPTYAREIQTPEYGHRLDGVLRKRSKDIVGIVNGLDYTVWNPGTDKSLFVNYSKENVSEGKLQNKRELQKSFGLKTSDTVPVFGVVSRLADQKGIDILLNILGNLLKENLQIAILGTGNPEYERALLTFASSNPDKLFVKIGFDPILANRIYAASDFFVMPSRYEPCGLGQLIAMRYGTIPIVRATGGLKDTVCDISEPDGYGIVFENYSEKELYNAIMRAFSLYQNPESVNKLRRRIMTLDFSWDRSAKEYIKVYKRLILSKKSTTLT